jgi:hypothetical protein
MTNPIKGEVPLVLADGRRFVLVLDIEALVDAEAAYEKPMAILLSDVSQGFLGATAALLQGALQRLNPVSRREALEMLTTDQGEVSRALTAAVELAYPEQSAGGKAAAAAPRPRGKASGRSGAKPG